MYILNLNCAPTAGMGAGVAWVIPLPRSWTKCLRGCQASSREYPFWQLPAQSRSQVGEVTRLVRSHPWFLFCEVTVNKIQPSNSNTYELAERLLGVTTVHLYNLCFGIMHENGSGTCMEGCGIMVIRLFVSRA